MLLWNNLNLIDLVDKIFLKNQYALEILESIAIENPLQEQINHIKFVLVSAQSISDFKTSSHLKTSPSNSNIAILLIESDHQINFTQKILIFLTTISSRRDNHVNSY